MTAELGLLAAEETETTHHEAHLIGLQPYTRYYYRLDGGRLASNDKPWFFVFFHLAMFTSREEPGYLESGVRSRLQPLFERYEVDAVFRGHAHSYERIFVNDVTIS